MVDNTVGADWDNVQLSLVAGAPQSFIQPLSQPLYTRRPEIPIATEAQLTPQTHEAAEIANGDGAIGDDEQPADGADMASAHIGDEAGSYASVGVAGMAGLGGSSGGAVGNGAGVAAASIVPAMLFNEGDVSTNAFDDFFEYSLTQPVTIHKNESAMVPILQQELPAEHVTLWSEKEPTPLRAVWLENKSKLTLDSGSFSIFESGEFAGEGLLDPIHPGEKRLLSLRGRPGGAGASVTDRERQRTLHHVESRKGVVIETHMDGASVTYTATNSADEVAWCSWSIRATAMAGTLDDG